MINRLRSTKAPGYDLITGRILKVLPDIGIKAITHIYNSILRNGYFLAQWKVSQIIPILKPGKPADEVTSYSPISLLPILSIAALLSLVLSCGDLDFGHRFLSSLLYRIFCLIFRVNISDFPIFTS
jgi:hypothetical protein